MHSIPILTFSFPRFSGHLAQDETVGDDDHSEGDDVDGDDVEEVVRELVGGGGEEVKGNTLREPGELRMPLHVENNALKQWRQRVTNTLKQCGTRN